MKEKKLYLYGAHSVKELLESHPEVVQRLYMKQTLDKHTQEGFRALAQVAKVPVSMVGERDLKRYVGEVNDQGVVLLVSKFPYTDFDDFIEDLDVSQNPAIVIMDSLEDPHNAGAIIRTAAGLGASAVILPSSRQVAVTQTVFKVSAGAVNHIPIIQAGSLTKVLNTLKKKGFWIGALAKSDKREENLLSHSFTTPTVFIVGNEGRGVRASVIGDSDYIVSVPISEKVESYNASVSLAIALYEWKRQNS